MHGQWKSIAQMLHKMVLFLFLCSFGSLGAFSHLQMKMKSLEKQVTKMQCVQGCVCMHMCMYNTKQAAPKQTGICMLLTVQSPTQ